MIKFYPAVMTREALHLQMYAILVVLQTPCERLSAQLALYLFVVDAVLFFAIQLWSIFAGIADMRYD